MAKLISGMVYHYRVELVYQIVLAREEYMRDASVEKEGKSFALFFLFTRVGGLGFCVYHKSMYDVGRSKG